MTLSCSKGVPRIPESWWVRPLLSRESHYNRYSTKTVTIYSWYGQGCPTCHSHHVTQDHFTPVFHTKCTDAGISPHPGEEWRQDHSECMNRSEAHGLCSESNVLEARLFNTQTAYLMELQIVLKTSLAKQGIKITVSLAASLELHQSIVSEENTVNEPCR